MPTEILMNLSIERMEGVYEQAIGIIITSNLQDNFQQRCRKIVLDTSGMGWGFHDTLSEIYEEAF